MKISNLALSILALVGVTTLSAYYQGGYHNYDYSPDARFYRDNCPQQYGYRDTYSEVPSFQNTPGNRGPRGDATFIPSPNQPRNLYQNRGGYHDRYIQSNQDLRFQEYNRNFRNNSQNLNQNRNLENFDQTYQSGRFSKESADTNYADTTTTSNIVESRIHTALQKDSSLSQQARNIDISEKDGNVTLTGNVPTKTEKDRVIAIIKGVDGVKTVTDRVTIAQ